MERGSDCMEARKSSYSIEPSCGNCFLYSEKKKICPIDGKHRTKVNGCYMHFVPKEKN